MISKVVFVLSVVFFHANASNFSERIIGGPPPLQSNDVVVSVQYMGEHICGGVIYKTKYVITAAQCIYGKNDGAITIRQGSPTHGTGGAIRYVKNVRRHENYNPEGNFFDIAVLEMKEYTQGIASVTLPKKNDIPESLTVYGWGKDKDNIGDNSPKLKKVDVNIHPRETCEKELGNLWINKDMICTKTPNKGACDGDQGGPLMQETGAATYVLYGIYSWNLNCTSGLNVYTNVYEVKDFITRNAP